MTRPARDDAWFVRVRRPGSYNVIPCTPQGWAATIAYVAASLALTPVLLPVTPVRIAAWAILFGAATLLFVLLVWRTSAPAADDSKGRKQ